MLSSLADAVALIVMAAVLAYIAHMTATSSARASIRELKAERHKLEDEYLSMTFEERHGVIGKACLREISRIDTRLRNLKKHRHG